MYSRFGQALRVPTFVFVFVPDAFNNVGRPSVHAVILACVCLACMQPRLIYSMLHEKVSVLSLGRDYTVVVTGDGGADPQSSLLESSTSGLPDPARTNSWEPSPHILTAADLKRSSSQAVPLPANSIDPPGPSHDGAGPDRPTGPPAPSTHPHGGPEQGAKRAPQGGLQQRDSTAELEGTPYPPVPGSPQLEPEGLAASAPGDPLAAPSPSVSIWTERSNVGGP